MFQLFQNYFKMREKQMLPQAVKTMGRRRHKKTSAPVMMTGFRKLEEDVHGKPR
jgi:hypothetical protein